MFRLTVSYAPPADPEAFDRAYADEHLPLVKPIPGLQAFTYTKVRPLGGEPTVYQFAELDFADAGSLRAALTSPEMGAAVKHAEGLGSAMSVFNGEVVKPF